MLVTGRKALWEWLWRGPFWGLLPFAAAILVTRLSGDWPTFTQLMGTGALFLVCIGLGASAIHDLRGLTSIVALRYICIGIIFLCASMYGYTYDRVAHQDPQLDRTGVGVASVALFITICVFAGISAWVGAARREADLRNHEPS